jgi:phytoene synthase
MHSPCAEGAASVQQTPRFPQARSAFDADLAACRVLLRDGSRTFLAASHLLPRAVREPACALYAFCRVADDEVDQGGDSRAAVASLRERLARLYAGTPAPVAADRALAHVVRRFAIPRTLLEALIEGFEWDSQHRRYDSLDELEAYAMRVAGTVGAIMALLMGVRNAAALARACELGVAMQLSNIARDVGEDARAGRLYLPQAWLREAGIDPQAFLARPSFSPALASVVRRLLDQADALYRRVDAGVAMLPLACRPGINAARFLYAAIGHQVARQGYDSIARRAIVGRRTKARHLARALWAVAPARSTAALPALPTAEYLIQAVVALPAVPPPINTYQRLVWTLDLFQELAQRERGTAGVSLPLQGGAGAD